MEDSAKPDLKAGFPFAKLKDGGMILGQVDGEDVILARRGDELFAVGAACTAMLGDLAAVPPTCQFLAYYRFEDYWSSRITTDSLPLKSSTTPKHRWREVWRQSQVR